MHYLALFLSVTGWLLAAIITADFAVTFVATRIRERRDRKASSARLQAVVSPRKDLL